MFNISCITTSNKSNTCSKSKFNWISLVNGSKNIPEAQKLVDWLISQKGQQQIVAQKTYFYPIRNDVDFGSLPPLSTIKLVEVDESWAAQNKTRLVERWVNEVLPAGD